MKKKKSIKFKLFLVLIIIVSSFIMLLNLGMLDFVFGTKVEAETIQEKMQSVSEIAGLEIDYNNKVKYSETYELAGIDIPFTTSEFTIIYDATIKLGVDLEDTIVFVQDNTINIHLSDIIVLSHEIDMEEAKSYNEKSSIFNPINPDDYVDFFAEVKAEKEEAIVNEEAITTAQENTEEAIKKLLSSVPGVEDNYEFNFVFGN